MTYCCAIRVMYLLFRSVRFPPLFYLYFDPPSTTLVTIQRTRNTLLARNDMLLLKVDHAAAAAVVVVGLFAYSMTLQAPKKKREKNKTKPST